MHEMIEKKKFIFGVNYWASKNAIKMWKDQNGIGLNFASTFLKLFSIVLIPLSTAFYFKQYEIISFLYKYTQPLKM